MADLCVDLRHLIGYMSLRQKQSERDVSVFDELIKEMDIKTKWIRVSIIWSQADS